jgi:hypothetical protein
VHFFHFFTIENDRLVLEKDMMLPLRSSTAIAAALSASNIPIKRNHQHTSHALKALSSQPLEQVSARVVLTNESLNDKVWKTFF